MVLKNEKLVNKILFFYEKTKYINNESIVLMGRTNLNFPNLETLQRLSAHIENFEFVFTAKNRTLNLQV